MTDPDGTGPGAKGESWWSHPDGPTGHGPGFRLPPGRRVPEIPAGGPVDRFAPASGGPVASRFRSGVLLRTSVLMVLAVLCAGLLGGGVGAVVQSTRQGGRITLHPATDASVRRPPGSTAGMVKAVLPGVVYLRVDADGSSGSGTGVVLDGAGHILTNNHVVAPSGRLGRVTVTFSTGQSHPAALVGRDVDSDLAVIQVKGVSGLHPLALGSSEALNVGDPVVAIGAPFGLRGTVTAGIISAKDRPLISGSTDTGSGPSYLDALQTDAPINPGNSGGPLLDAGGALVGLNTVIRSANQDSADPYGVQDASGSIGLGFAIPVEQALRVAEQLINNHRAVHTRIGATLDLVHQGEARVVAVGVRNSPLQVEDLVTALDGTPVTSGDDLIALVRGRRPGSTVVLTVQRDGSTQQLPTLLLSTSLALPPDSG